MNSVLRSTAGLVRYQHPDGAGAQLLSAGTLIGDKVCNRTEDELGEIKELMLNTVSGSVCYAVVAAGGFLSMGEKLYAVPWSALTLDGPNKRLVLDVDVERFRNAPGFDKDKWPDMADETWVRQVHAYYGLKGVEAKPAATAA